VKLYPNPPYLLILFQLLLEHALKAIKAEI